ncbi:MAG: SDR family oxidoreductase [Bacteroidota bacterium]
MNTKGVMLITGTRKGIGYELATHYAGNGYTVIGCSRGESSLTMENYFHYVLDITDEKSVRSMFGDIRKKYGRLDVLINNAAINQTLSPAILVSLSAAENTMRTNFLGSFLMAREGVKIMMKNSFGRIINMGSMAVKHEEKGEAIYTASKAAVIAFTKVLAKEVYDYGITCNVVSPSAIQTDMLEPIDKEALQQVLKRNAIPELGTAAELIHTLNWLIDKDSNKITGQNIYLGGV